MEITRKSMLSGVVRTRELPVTQKQMDIYERTDEKIQDVFPELSAGDREFIMTGITDEEWDAAFKEPEDEEQEDGI